MTALAEQPAPVVNDVAAVLEKHQRNGRECSCLLWDWRECDFPDHQARELNTVGLISYRNVRVPA